MEHAARTPERILIIRPSALGDVCKSVPVLASLRRAFPQARIDWLVQDSFAGAIAHHPALSEAVLFPRRDLGRTMRRARPGPSLRFLGDLRRRGYGLVFDMQALARSGIFAWATRAPRRVGFADARELGWLGASERYRVGQDLHSVDRMLELLRCAGVEPVADMRLYTGESERAWLHQDPALAGRRYAVVAPTSRWAGKRWPADRFARLTESLLGRGLEAVAIVGSESERDQCAPLLELAARDPRVIDRVGRTTVGQLMALVESSSLVIANDSAVLHMAVGFGRPLVALYGPTRLDRVGPYGRSADVIQHVTSADRLDHKDAALGRALMERITLDEVLSRSTHALDSRPPIASTRARSP